MTDKNLWTYLENILVKESKYCPIAIHMLYTRYVSSDFINNGEKMSKPMFTKLLKKNPSIFTVKGNLVSLTESVSQINQSINYYYLLLISKPTKSYTYEELMALTEFAPTHVKMCAPSEKKLRIFLACFGIFKLKREEVTLTKSCLRKSLTHLKSSSALETTLSLSKSSLPIIKDDDAGVCDFFVKFISRTSKYCPISWKRLFNQRSTGYMAQLVAKDSLEFRIFLQRHPEVFIVKKFFVTLTSSASKLDNIAAYYASIINLIPEKKCTFEELLRLSNFAPMNIKKLKCNLNLKDICLFFDNVFEVHPTHVVLKNRVQPKKISSDFSETLILSESDDTPEFSCSNFNELSSEIWTDNEILMSDSECQSPFNEISRSVDDITQPLQNLDIDYNSSDLKMNAAKYFLKILWNSKPFTIVHIDELYHHSLHAPPDVRQICGHSPQKLIEFLNQYPSLFIITDKNVLPRKNIPRKKWTPPYKGIEEPICDMLLNFFKEYTKNGKPRRVCNLYNETGCCFMNKQGQKYFEKPIELEQFLGMFPDNFYVYNGEVVNILNHNKLRMEKCNNEGSRNTVVPKVKSSDLPLEKLSNDSLNWKKEVLDRTELVEDVGRCKEIVKLILSTDKVIALDCEGLNLGVDGILSLVQIGTESGKIFIFDILNASEMITEGNLKCLLESTSVLKVIHDCHNDSANLFNEYQVRLKNIFDTRIAYGVIKGYLNVPIGFNNLCEMYGAEINVEKDEFKNIYRTRPDVWLDRPITPTMLAYAALDVASLVPVVYNNMMKKLPDAKYTDVLKLSLAISEQLVLLL